MYPRFLVYLISADKEGAEVTEHPVERGGDVLGLGGEELPAHDHGEGGEPEGVEVFEHKEGGEGQPGQRVDQVLVEAAFEIARFRRSGRRRHHAFVDLWANHFHVVVVVEVGAEGNEGDQHAGAGSDQHGLAAEPVHHEERGESTSDLRAEGE